MKLALFILAALVPFTSVAGSRCPNGTQRTYNCASTPKNGDSVVIGGMLDNIKVCEGNGDAYLIFEKDGEDPGPVLVTYFDTTGGRNYKVGDDDATYTLSIPQTFGPSQSWMARFYVDLPKAGVKGDSTYTCK